MQYIIRTPQGEEYGPADEATLVKWAGDGRIRADYEIRNEVMRKWHRACEMPFLKDVLRDPTIEVKESAAKKLGKFVDPSAEEPQGQVISLTKSGVFKYSPADAMRRGLACLTDLLVIAGIGAGLGFGLPAVLQGEVVFLVFIAGTLGLTLLYLAVSMGFFAQTLGQYFWGIMVIRPDGRPVLLGRAYIFALFSLLVLPTTWVMTYCTRSQRGLAERIAGLVVCRTRVLD